MKKVITNNISSLYKNINIRDEFEVSFGGYKKENNVSLQQFLNILNYMNVRSQKEKLNIEIVNILDINYKYDSINNNIYRISIEDINYLNQLMPMISSRKNHVIFSILANNEKFQIIRKEKDLKNRIDIDEYDLRFRLSKESVLSKKEIEKANLLSLTEKERFNIIFRYKQRTTLYLINNKDCTLKLEVSLVRQSNNINKVQENIREIYEIELEYIAKKNDSKMLDIMINEIETIKKAIYQIPFILDNTTSKKVVDEYIKLVFNEVTERQEVKTTYLMQPITTEIQNITDNIPARYTITDKADGDRYHLYIYDSKVYLISTNLQVIYTNIEVDKKYNDTIIDGEYVFIAEKQKFIFLGFDILYGSGTDVRKLVQLKERVQIMYELIEKCFSSKLHPKDYDGEFKLDKIIKYYQNELKLYVTDMIDTLNKSNNTILVKSKYYIFPMGGNDCEVFTYTKVIWDVMQKNIYNLELPYYLDGIMYTPIEQKYTKYIKDTKQFTYKWKPPQLTSIDMYITFEKDKETGKILNLYDNSDTTDLKIDNNEDKNESNVKVRNKVYRICNLNVSRIINDVERPIPFKRNDNLNQCHLYLEDGLVRDLEGDQVHDETVVEFYYNDELTIPEKERWVPIRTRYDKTEAVKKYGIKYGNNEEVANKIWRAIRNKVTIDDINILADPIKYNSYISVLRNRIDKSVIASERIQNEYYQIITKITKPQRSFRDYMKSNMIYMYCSKKKLVDGQEKAMTVLDIGCGKGVDIMKFYHPRIKYLVGIDIDANGLHFATDGALSRYDNFRKKTPYFPNMYFIQADGGMILKLEEQMKANSKMTDENRTLIEKHFGENRKKFDVINCQFAINNMFKDDNTLNNFCENINMYLNKDGYMLVSVFDGEIVYNKLKENKGKHTVYYTTNEGNNRILHDIIQRFKDENIKKTGITVDIFDAEHMNEGEYMPEYLVHKDYLIETLYNKCGMVVIETDTFENIYNIYSRFFREIGKYDNIEKSRDYFADIGKFYDESNEMNKSVFEVTKLNRYYVFQKINN
jgi:hypothetical protein